MTAIQISGERLAAMYDNDMTVYVTPGAEDQPYWASRPQFQNDYGMSFQAIIDQLSADAGYDVDIDDLRSDESLYEFQFEA